jgi:UDP-N-acetylglucosamine diphosphorylase/glucosamine-1-phosphate N-acetyltransferase
MHYILFDDYSWHNLLPLTFTRPVCELRVGILTIKEKWEKYLGETCSYLTQDHLKAKFAIRPGDDNLLVNGSVLPDPQLLEALLKLETGQVLADNDLMVGVRTTDIRDLSGLINLEGYREIPYVHEYLQIGWPWDIFRNNGKAITDDFTLLTRGKNSARLSATNMLIHPENIFCEPGFRAEGITLNASTGPIYLGKDSEIMEGTVIRGPFSLGENSVIKLNAKIYGPTTIGPHSKAGGEINNSVIQGYSNKGHDGFLGNSVLGAWCNIGADSNNSNLKNNYARVRIWNYPRERFIDTGLTFCGLIMGDHSKCGINTMFNTGTVVGVNANIFGSGFPRPFIPSFSWGGPQGFTVYTTEKAFEVTREVMSRREVEFDDNDKAILQSVFEMTDRYRNF